MDLSLLGTSSCCHPGTHLCWKRMISRHLAFLPPPACTLALLPVFAHHPSRSHPIHVPSSNSIWAPLVPDVTAPGRWKSFVWRRNQIRGVESPGEAGVRLRVPRRCAARTNGQGGWKKTERKPKSLMVCLRCPKVAAPGLAVTGLLAGRAGWKDCRLFTVLGP